MSAFCCHRRRQRVILSAVFFLGLVAGNACQVPVFRFALERWDADAYTVAVVSSSEDGALTSSEKEVVRFLETASEDGGLTANVAVRTAGGSGVEVGESRMELYYPQKIRGLEVSPIWTGALTMQNARLIMDSPVRREFVKRLLTGESATWLLVRSGDAEKDRGAAEALTQFAASAKDVLKIPEGVIGRGEFEGSGFTGDPDNVLRSDVPLQIAFSFIEIDRADPAEAVFLQMLLNIEDDLGELASEPMAFPVFGRGRVLEPLVGAGVTRENALDYAGYVCGACSCEMKDQNPGLDLLVAADWNAALEGSEVVIEKVLPPLEGVGSVLEQSLDPSSQGQAEKSTVEAESNAGGSSLSPAEIMGVTLAAATFLVVLGSFFFRKNRG